MKKSGFIALIGRTNAGKSSLLNYLLEEKISMVSHKINATRRKINAIIMHEDNQIIVVDTPGLHDSQKTINKLMVEVALKSMNDCDLVLFLATIHDDIENYQKFLKLNPGIKHIILLTKTDESTSEQVANKISSYQQFQEKFLALMPINIKRSIFRREILNQISKNLPEHEYFFDPEIISSTNIREIYRDFILEAIFDSTSSEVPYSTDVIIDKIIEKPNLISVFASLISDTDSHKQILIGKNGQTLKRIGIKSRKLIASFSHTKIFIKLNVIVKKGWKSNEKMIKRDFIY